MDMKIDYVEFNTPEIEASTAFCAKAFGWTFQAYGPDYAGIENGGIDGGFDGTIDGAMKVPLIVLKAGDLEAAEAAIVGAGGKIVRPIYAFPGGRRFHFREPGGNELAVWSEL